MAVTAIAPTPGNTNTQGANITRMTPPKITGKSWLGVDPRQTMNTATAREGIEGYLGRTLTPEEIQRAVGLSGYDDDTFTKDWTGEQYNKILQYGANATGNTYTPWSTTETTGDEGSTPGINPGTQPTTGAAPPIDIPEYQRRGDLQLPEYQRRGDFSFDASALENDPGYQFRQKEAQRALAHQGAAAGNVRGGNFMRDLLQVSQGLASDEFNQAYGRAADTYDRNTSGDRYAHEQATGRATGIYDRGVADDRYANEAGVNRAQLEYAPRLLTWQRDRDESQRNRELNFDRDWQREVYGRDDAWRRHVYGNDDAWRRYELEENRRRFLANGGTV
jgi:hypothetical protein